MANKLKTLKDLVFENVISYGQDSLFWTQKDDEDKKFVFPERLKQEGIKIFKNLQSSETIYPILLRDFPETSKGSIAKKMWDDDNFRYGSEYGMLAMLMYFFNITKEDLKTDVLVSKGDGQ